jgi:hypothetical protein
LSICASQTDGSGPLLVCCGGSSDASDLDGNGTRNQGGTLRVYRLVPAVTAEEVDRKSQRCGWSIGEIAFAGI